MKPKVRLSPYIYDGSALVVTLLLAALLAIPGVGTVFSNAAERSKWENRPLAELPKLSEFSVVSGFFKQIDDYLNDHFGFALDLNRAHRRFVFYVFGDSPASQITVGKDGYIFLNGSAGRGAQFDRLRTVCVEYASGASANSVVDEWTEILSFFEERFPRVTMLIPPSKPVLYPDKLPLSVPREIREACSQYRTNNNPAQQLALWGQGRATNVLNLYDAFYRARFEGNFYPKENFHSSGASNHLMAHLAFAHLGLVTDARFAASRIDYTTTWDLKQFFGFPRPVVMPVFDYLGFGIKVRRGQPESVREWFEHARDFGTYLTDRPLSQRSALVISDSYGYRGAKHLAPGFKSVVWVNTNSLQAHEVAGFFGEFVRNMKPDDLIFLFHEGSLPRRALNWLNGIHSLKDTWPPESTGTASALSP